MVCTGLSLALRQDEGVCRVPLPSGAAHLRPAVSHAASRGGFVGSSGVVLWALLAPLTLLLFHGSRASVPWFIAYTLLVMAAGVADPLLSGVAPEAPRASSPASSR